MKNYSEIGHRYAKALFELAEESKLIGNVENDQENIKILTDLDNYDFHSDGDFIRKLENLAYDF